MVGRWVCLGWIGAACLACSVGDLDDSAPFGESQSVAEGSGGSGTTGSLTTGVSVNPTAPGGTTDSSVSESGPLPSTGADEDSTSGGAGSSSSGGWTGLSGRGDSSSGGAGSECGNGVLERGESCDTDDLGATECADVGDFVGGELSCDAACAFDTSGCTVMGGEPVSVCENINLAIPDNGAAVTTVVNVPAGGEISDVTVAVDITHTWIGDLSVDVEHGGTTVSLFDQACTSEEDISLVFDDGGAAMNCASSTSGAPTLPVQPLSAFDGLDAAGAWTFSFQDGAAEDVGSATQVCVNVEF